MSITSEKLPAVDDCMPYLGYVLRSDFVHMPSTQVVHSPRRKRVDR